MGKDIRYGVDGLLQDGGPIVLGGQQLYPDTAVVALLHHLLRHIGIGREQLAGIVIGESVGNEASSLTACRLREEGVIEVDDMSL